MSNVPPNSNLDQLDEELVAYLDGELPPTEARRIEDMLAGDERARQRLNQLASSWDLLDQLPRSAVDENFTRTTVEMAALSTEEEITRQRASEPLKRRLRWLGAAVIALSAAGVGFVAVTVATPHQNDALLRDLPIVEHFELYRPVGSIDLLRQLEAKGLFTTEPPPGFRGRDEPPAGDERAAADRTTKPILDSLAERRDWVAELEPEKKIELRRNFEQFSALSPEEQEALRQLDHHLRHDPDADQLARIMHRYQGWLKYLSPAERADLFDLSSEEKVAEIQQRKDKWERRKFAGKHFQWMQKFGEEHEQDLLPQLSDEAKQRLKKLQADRRGGDGLRQRWYYVELAREAWRDPNVRLPQLNDAEMKSFIEPFPRGWKQRFEDASSDQQVQMLRAWFQDPVFTREMIQRGGFSGGRRGGWWGPEPAERLKEFENELPREQREKLDKLSRHEKQAKLIQLYLEWRHRPDGPGFRPGDDFGPPQQRRGWERRPHDPAEGAADDVPRRRRPPPPDR